MEAKKTGNYSRLVNESKDLKKNFKTDKKVEKSILGLFNLIIMLVVIFLILKNSLINP